MQKLENKKKKEMEISLKNGKVGVKKEKIWKIGIKKGKRKRLFLLKKFRFKKKEGHVVSIKSLDLKKERVANISIENKMSDVSVENKISNAFVENKVSNSSVKDRIFYIFIKDRLLYLSIRIQNNSEIILHFIDFKNIKGEKRCLKRS